MLPPGQCSRSPVPFGASPSAGRRTGLHGTFASPGLQTRLLETLQEGTPVIVSRTLGEDEPPSTGGDTAKRSGACVTPGGCWDGSRFGNRVPHLAVCRDAVSGAPFRGDCREWRREKSAHCPARSDVRLPGMRSPRPTEEQRDRSSSPGAVPALPGKSTTPSWPTAASRTSRSWSTRLPETERCTASTNPGVTKTSAGASPRPPLRS